MHKHITQPTYGARTKINNIIGEAVRKGLDIKPYGSRVVKHGFKTSSDYDYLLFDPKFDMRGKLMSNGFMEDGSHLSGQSPNHFQSMKTEVDGQVLNVIAIFDKDVYEGLLAASNMCRLFNVKKKEDRIKLAEHFTDKTLLDQDEFNRIVETGY